MSSTSQRVERWCETVGIFDILLRNTSLSQKFSEKFENRRNIWQSVELRCTVPVERGEK